jgi:hypothetical protein
MSECQFQLLIGAYHDGELKAEMMRQVERHVEQCPACRAELAATRDLSARIAAVRLGEIDRVESLRLHEVIDEAAAGEQESLPLFRTAGLLAAMAASVLIVSGVWLLDLKPAGRPVGTTGGGTSVVLAPEWEQVAMTLHADPRPQTVEDSLYAPRYANTVKWMLDGLVLTER